MPSVKLDALDGNKRAAQSIIQQIRDDNPGSIVEKHGVDWVVMHSSRLVIRRSSIQAAVAQDFPVLQDRHWKKIILAFDRAPKETQDGWELD